ncbi:MAG: GNAT family N-acetyltransferase [Thermodesulfobacteriota bacterium]
MKVAPLQESDFAAYGALAEECGTVFNSTKWLSLFGESVEPVGIYSNSHTLIGGFHLYTKRQFGLTVCRNAPFTPHCGPFLKVTAKNPVAIMDTWKKALKLMAKYIHDKRLPVVSVALDKKIVDMQPFIWEHHRVTPQYTYTIDLDLPIEAILRNMSPDRRNDIKKGERTGLNVRMIDRYDAVKTMVCQSFSRQNRSVDTIHLDAVLSRFAETGNSFAFLAGIDDVPIAASFCVHDRETAFYLLGGYAQHGKHRSAGPLACWEAIKHAKRLGLKTFDFEGSMVPDIEHYFRGFGGRLVPYYRVTKAMLPIEMVLKLFKRGLF